jgi:chitinase
MPTPTNTPTAVPTLAASRRFIGYFAAWGFYNAPFHYVKDLIAQGAAQRLTTINYAFTNVKNNACVVGVTATGVGDAYADYQVAMDAAHSVDGVADMAGQNLMGHWNQLRKLKALYPNLKVVMSLGGWTWSGGFSDAALPANRQAFVASCVDAFIRGNIPLVNGTGGPGSARGVFDGIDIDWEYPAAAGLPGNVYRPEDTQNFTALLAEFRSQLDAQGAIDGKHYLLTIAAPAGEDKYTHIQLNSIHQYLDWANLMTYDFHGAWDTTGPTNFMAPLYGSPADPSVGVSRNYNIDYAVNAYIAAGFPANKLVLGLPYYGRGWTGVPPGPNNNGLYQSATGPAPSTRINEDGMEFYRTLKANYESTYTKFYDPITKAMWIYNPGTSVWWSYDDPTSLATKLAYMRAKGLGGAMAWELQADTADGELTRAIFNQLNIP